MLISTKKEIIRHEADKYPLETAKFIKTKITPQRHRKCNFHQINATTLVEVQAPSLFQPLSIYLIRSN